MKQRFESGAKSLSSIGFTLIEVMVSIAVLTLLVLGVSKMLSSTSAIARTETKHIDTDTQARAVFDRLATDIRQMVHRTDVDYYIKQPIGYSGHGNGHAYGHRLSTGEQGSDQLAFFSQVPGYYPSTVAQGSISLISYRVNSNSSSPAYLRLERMAKGLLWNGADTQTNQNGKFPIVFLPATISAVSPWYGAVNNDSTAKSADTDFEVLGPNVFRFEYYYLLKNGNVKDVPWDQDARPSQQTIALPTSIGLTDVQAIGVAIAVIDPASRALVNSANPTGLLDLASDLDDFKSAPGRGVGGAKKVGDMEVQWNEAVASAATTGRTSSNTIVPQAAVSSIRVYTRYFDLGDE